MSLLSLDVGITTGYCIQDGEGKVIAIGIIEWEDQASFRWHLMGVIGEFQPTHCIIEAPVILRGPLGDSLKSVMHAVTGMRLPPCEYVTPAQWKGTPQAKLKVPGHTKLTPHERDAYRMGRWWLQSRQSSD